MIQKIFDIVIKISIIKENMEVTMSKEEIIAKKEVLIKMLTEYIC